MGRFNCLWFGFSYLLFFLVIHVYGSRTNPETAIIFPNQIRSERDLPECNLTSTTSIVCSVVQKRYWLPLQLYRYCRCPSDTGPCPTEWVSQSQHSFMLNNRAQFKFCSSVNNIATCKSDQTAVVLLEPIGLRPLNVTGSDVVTPAPSSTNSTDSSTSATPTAATTTPTTTIQVSCQCPINYKWTITGSQTSTDDGTNVITRNSTYSCQPLRRCNARSSCGRVTKDTYSIYHQCSCKRGKICILNNDRSLHNVTELLYNGPAYYAKCHNR